ncbi:hypothetical protein IGI04_007521, partial [Brassica rapa subsp. trilocularis]
MEGNQSSSFLSLCFYTLNEETPIAEIYGITSDIRNLILDFDFVSFVWIQRSENKAADSLAKQA